MNLDPDVFLSDLMKNEMTRIKDKKQMELLSTERYNLPAPTPGLRHDPEAWIQAGKIKLGQKITSKSLHIQEPAIPLKTAHLKCPF